MECPFRNGFLTAFLKAKALELACLILFRLAGTAEEVALDGVRLSLSDQRKLKQAMTIIEGNLEATPDINELVAAVGLSRPKLQLGFRLLYGDTVARIRDKRRMERALKLVRSTSLSMIDIAAEIGYDHAASFTRAFRSAFGESPLRVRRMAQQSALLNKMEIERGG
jgi:transcriptional regulator GlxA family with amidase domain